MVKHERLVYTMSLEERIRLVLCTERYKNHSLGGYAFPTFEIIDNPALNKEIIATDFPTDRALCASWNPELIKTVYKFIGNETKASVPFAYYNVSNKLKHDDATSDYYLAGCCASAKIKGLNQSNTYVNFTDDSAVGDGIPLKESVQIVTDKVLQAATPDSITVKETNKSSDYFKTYKYGNLLFGVADDKNDAVRFLFEGCTLVFVPQALVEELVPHIIELTVEYKKAYEQFKIGKIKVQEMDRRCRALEILDEKMIDVACGNVINMLVELKNQNADAVMEQATSLNPSVEHSPIFDEVLHNKYAYDAAAQSIVMIKNDKALPFAFDAKIALLGEYAKHADYRNNGNKKTTLNLSFDVINDYDLKAVGYAHGYARGESGRTDLIASACDLAEQADFALVYLFAEHGTNKLPVGQLELLDALFDRNIQTVAVVSAEDNIDFSFVDKCRAVLLSYRVGQGEANAVFDIVTGAVNPSGKLPCDVYESEQNTVTDTAADDNAVTDVAAAYKRTAKYPFGYGLSYTQFEYSHLKIKENGISCTVTNAGEHDGYATVQMYVQQFDTKSALSEKSLRGFSKVFIKKHDSVKVEIPFGEETFRCYDEEYKCYGIEGGQYNIYVGDSLEDIRLNGEITLAGCDFTDKFENLPEEPVGDFVKSMNEFLDSEDKQDKLLRKRGVSFGIKLFLAITIGLYCNLMLAAFAFTEYFGMPSTVRYIVIGVLAVFVNLFLIIYIVKIVRRRKELRNIQEGTLIDRFMANVNDFDQVSTVTFEEPVETDDEADEFESEEEEEETEEVQKPEEKKEYEAFIETEEQELNFKENASLADLCAGFHDYVRGRGIEIDTASVRQIFSAIAASRLVIINAKNKEALPDFVSALSGYFNDAGIVEADEDWNSPDDLMWTFEGDKYVASPFVSSVFSAVGNREKNAVVIINNVSQSNLRSYFGEMISFALSPSEEFVLKLNDDTSTVLPRNLCYILIPADGEDSALPPDVAFASVQIEVSIAKAEPTEPKEVEPVSYIAFEGLIKEAREEKFLPETTWKKIDELIETLGSNERFALGNKNVLQLERFTSVLLAGGGDESEALIALFTSKLVAILKNLKAYKQDGGDRTVYGIIEKLFNEEDLSKVQKALLKNSYEG